MADAFPIMSLVSPETPDALAPSRIMGCFSQLLVMLSALIEAERDLEHFDIWDIATAHWLRDAELAHTRVATLIGAIRNASSVLPADRKLQRVATLIDMMIGSEEPGTFQHPHRNLHRIDGLFRHAGAGPVARRVAELLAGARSRIDALATLSTFVDPLIIDDLDDAQEAPAAA